MLPRVADGPLADIEFLARSAHRVTALEALADSPRTRVELRELTGASRSTIGRTLHEFESRQWTSRDGDQYEATQLGSFVASGMVELIDLLKFERQLRTVWRSIPAEASGFSIEMGTDAVVTVAEADNPYRPVNRFASLLEETSRFRFVGRELALLEPCKDELRRRVVDGMRTEIIDPPTVTRYILSTYPEHCRGALQSGHLTVRVHDDLPPYGVCIFDDRTGISCYDPESGTVRVFIDTDRQDARAWAETTFEAYRRESRPLALETVSK